jgi:hypothetical protein
MYTRFLLSFLFSFNTFLPNNVFVSGENCVVRSKSDGGDDTPALLDAFKRCGQDGTIALPDQTYHINQVMNTTELKNCKIDLKGTLLVTDTSGTKRNAIN